MRRLELAGKTFGRLTVIEKAPSRNGRARWKVQCLCGTETVVAAGDLQNGHTTSCGCRRRQTCSERMTRLNTTHGHTRNGRPSPTYKSWDSMFARCYNEKAPNYHLYGARAIKVCRRWFSFANFLADMKERLAGTTLDRKENDKGYTPSNSRWATVAQQARNRRNGRLNTNKVRQIRTKYAAGNVTQAALAKEFGVHPATILKVVRNERWRDVQQEAA
jgi:hypothetical protein